MPALPWQIDTYKVTAKYEDGEIVDADFDVPMFSDDTAIAAAARETLVDLYVGHPTIESIVLLEGDDE